MAVGRKTGGRKAGTPNKAGAETRALARKHGKAAIETLRRALTEPKDWHSRIMAARLLLERGYGAPKQSLDIHEDAPLAVPIINIYGNPESPPAPAPVVSAAAPLVAAALRSTRP
jgi:hypothetical protein